MPSVRSGTKERSHCCALFSAALPQKTPSSDSSESWKHAVMIGAQSGRSRRSFFVSKYAWLNIFRPPDPPQHALKHSWYYTPVELNGRMRRWIALRSAEIWLELAEVCQKV